MIQMGRVSFYASTIRFAALFVFIHSFLHSFVRSFAPFSAIWLVCLYQMENEKWLDSETTTAERDARIELR